MTTAPTTGETIKALREKRHLTLTALAAAAGLNKGHLHHIENDKTQPSLETLRAIARALRVKPSRLLAA